MICDIFPTGDLNDLVMISDNFPTSVFSESDDLGDISPTRDLNNLIDLDHDLPICELLV